MWNYLERLLGKSSHYYEQLMRSRDVKEAISPATISRAVELIKPLVKNAYGPDRWEVDISVIEIPLNKKGQEIPYFRSFRHPQYDLNLFIDQQKYVKDQSSIELVVCNKASTTAPAVDGFPSLPICEAFIQHDASIHHELVKLNAQHPWTLYRDAKEKIVGKNKHDQVSGYPQWLVNDIDYRNIMGKEFLLQLELFQSGEVIFFFLDEKTKQVEFYRQKL